MDEVAFVESLFAPEMRSSLPLLSPPSLESLQAMGFASPPNSAAKLLLQRSTHTPTANGAVPPPPNSLLGGGILHHTVQQPFQAGSGDQPLFVRLQDDDVFSQLLADQDFDLQEKKDKAPNSLLLEPLDLPKSEGVKEEATTFQYQRAVSSAAASPPTSGFGLDMMPVFPLSGGVNTPMFFNNHNNFPPLSPPSSEWIHDQDVSTPSGCSFQRVHMTPMSMKHMMASSLSMSSPMVQQQPSSSGCMELLSQAMTSSQHQTQSPLWISASRATPPEAPFSGDKFSVARPPFSLTISPPASLTSRDVKALKELIVSADYGLAQTPSTQLLSRPLKRSRSTLEVVGPRAKAVRLTTASPVGQENLPQRANVKVTKGKKCIEPNCTRRAQSNSRCKAHGGGARCQYNGPGGCNRSSQGGGFCRAHGGGKRCEFPGCQRGQQRKGRCYVHGGIRKCQFGSCEKKDRGNGFCISHGGGKRCEHPGCARAVRRGKLCQVHETQQAVEQGQGETLLL